MAPTKSTRAVSKQSVAASTLTSLMPLARKGLARRTTSNVQDQNVDIMQTRAKRKAEHSPQKVDSKIKRSALGNLTNNVNNHKLTTLLSNQEEDCKQQQQFKKKELVQNLFGQQNAAAAAQILKDQQNVILQQAHQGALPPQKPQQQPQPTKILTRASTRTHKDGGKENITSKMFLEDQQANKLMTAACQSMKSKQKDNIPAAPQPPLQHHQIQKVANKPVRRISNEFNKTEESLYMSALEDVSGCDSMRLSANFEAVKRRSALAQQNKTDDSKIEDEKAMEEKLPEGVEDIDKANWNDLFLVSHYARNIFEYLKQREPEFAIDDYMERQLHISKWMRSLLVDWMVEVQETFELNHETLYLAVKIVDLFLCKEIINKDKLQLLGAAALFIACKFDERTPPLIEDFLYICDGAYKHDELIQMEIVTLKVIQFDLGIPLSYRFLRRYARCAKTQMPTLTLARYILELSLMDYDCITLSDSKMACAVLFMALRLHGEAKPWSSTLVHYTGYQLQDFAEIVPILNTGLHRKPKGTIKTIRSKYSHKIFHEVAKVPLMTTEQLFANNLDFDLITPEQQKLQKQQHEVDNGIYKKT